MPTLKSLTGRLVGSSIFVKASEGLGTSACSARILKVLDGGTYWVLCDDGEECEVDEDGEVLV